MGSAEEWSGIRALWSLLKRILSILAMAVFGGLVGGFTLGLATIFCYFIGSYLGFPVGLIAGGLIGSRMEPRNVAIVFVGASAAIWPATLIGNANTWDSYFTFGLALAAYSLVGLLLLMTANRIFDARTRWWLAVVLANTFWIACFVRFLFAIYR